MTQLDFRVYRVRDPFAFFAGLRDPHQMGSEEYAVPQERSWIERLADWKARERGRIRGFFRGQVSHAYRTERRRTQDRAEIAHRIVLNRTSFAQVPLLNPDQLVSAWRELLPDHRDAEYRRVPLDVKTPGVFLVEAVSGLLRAYTIVIVSDVGLVTKVSPEQFMVFAADRFTGEPKAGCDVQVLVDQKSVGQGRTAADGVLDLALPDAKSEHIVAIARCGDEVAATDPGGWFTSQPARQLVGYTYTDKPIYRPGHTVNLKSVLRWRERDAVIAFDRPTADISVSDTNDKVIFRQTVRVDEFGAVKASFPMPMTAALGYYNVRVASGDEIASAAFEVQEYRRPEFEVILTPEKRFVVQGEAVVATVQARYYFGQPVANARLRYVVNQQPYYSPFRWDEGAEGDAGNQYWYGDDQRVEGNIRLDAQGRGQIRVPSSVDDNGRDFSLRIEAQVMDASNREVSGNTIVHVTHGTFLLSARTSGYVFQAAQTVPVSVRATDYTGTPQSGVAVKVLVERMTYPSGRYNEPTATEVGQQTITTGGDGTANASLALPEQSGSFRIRAIAVSNDREIVGETWVWVPGAAETEIDEGDRYLELMSDKRSYAPGETARLIVRGEPVSGPTLVTKEGQQVTWHRLMRPSATDAIEVPIDARDIGDIYVNIAFMRDGRLNRAERRLSVPARDRSLQITLTPDRPTAKPQEPGVFTLQVMDAAGAPVTAQISLGVVDEAVYAIRPDDTPDPVRFFYRREYSRVGTTFSRDFYFTGYSGSERLQLAGRRRRPFTLADFKGDKQIQPQVRKDFPDAIYWLSDLVTDSTGRAKVSLKYPDALTTWRLTARAVTRDTKAGVGIVRTTTTKDLIVRVITPRFLTEGDRVALPTIAHNYLESAKETRVSIAVQGLATDAPDAITATTGSIDKGGERRDDWRFVASAVGSATVTATARTDTDADAVELAIPVLPYGLRRDTGSSGSLSGAAEHSSDVVVPATANPAARTVSVSLAPSMAGSLLGALDFLTEYPYGCTEQTISSFLPNVVVTRALSQLKLVPTERLSVLDRLANAGIRRLADFQHDAGGWGWWKTDANHPFMTAYALYALVEARRAGYQVEEYRISNGARALAAMYGSYPRAEPNLKAYVAYVLRRAQPEGVGIEYQRQQANQGAIAQAQYRHADALNELWDARARMTAYGRALLLLALDDAKDKRGEELAQSLLAEAITKGELTWWSTDHDPMLFDSVDTSVEATATALHALSRRDPANAVIDRGVRWLMLNRRGGYWSTTKQTAMALYGLLEVMRARNESPQPFSVEVFVNGSHVRTQAFTVASMTSADPVLLTVAAREGANTVRLVKSGGGTLYWSVRAAYYDTQSAAARTGSRQLAITRKYSRLVATTVKDRIVYREEAFDGRMNPGDVLAIRLTVAGSKDWRYLMIEDPLPAGVEAIQDTTAYPMERQNQWRWWWGSQTEYRDNRTVFFQEAFDQGRYEFVYLVKAISSGEFRAPPARVAPMYVPDAVASSEPQTVVVTMPNAGARR